MIVKNYKGFLIDLDGTIYRGKERIDSAVEFVHKLAEKGLPYLFVTNNSSKTPEQVANTLEGFGVSATSEQIITSSLATADYIYEQKQEANVFMIGEEGLKNALEKKGFALSDENVDYVIIGIDRAITYEKLAKACLAVRNGAELISTNADKAIPTERGLVPGNGAITSVVSTSTGVTPIFIGKPEPIIIGQALKRLGVGKEDAIMIGDNYDTDILAGINSGLDTLLVHTGVTTKEQLLVVKKQPTYVCDSLEEFVI
ncbi:TIGR01457 family HAD-type hydrolase [Pueribacillus theae]|uniref:Acid sugar phosphatase n=1 Tax=Pueribacillus theae TaxID=2171751 RepID=A0A2U1K4W8_9BACI|nr:TIGR01457 family HAD-type hydrolase [Pueribacillus theae]PWA11998.1 TIGR01457 family HAD-type hydrolase [Pueribacillus theae]